MHVTGTSTAPTGATLLCSGVVRLDPRGSLAWQGAVTFAFADPEPAGPFATVAVTGGTDDFRGARGEVRLFDESADGDDAESRTRYEVQLTSRR